MINGKYLNKGKEGITYVCDDGTALKIFFGDYGLCNEEQAKREYENLCNLFSADVNVPNPIGIEKVILDDIDLKSVGKLKVHTQFRTYALRNLLSGRELPAIRKQFIQGKSLYDRMLPSLKIKREVRKLHETIDRAGFVFTDIKADNYVVTPEGKVYLIDCGCLYPKSKNAGLTENPKWMQKRIPTCKFEEWLEILTYSLTEGDLY